MPKGAALLLVCRCAHASDFCGQSRGGVRAADCGGELPADCGGGRRDSAHGGGDARGERGGVAGGGAAASGLDAAGGDDNDRGQVGLWAGSRDRVEDAAGSGAANEEGPARIGPTLLAAHAVPPEFAGRREEYVRWIAGELIPEVAAAGLALFATPSATTALLPRKRRALCCGGAASRAAAARSCRAVPAGDGSGAGGGIGRGEADHLETATKRR